MLIYNKIFTFIHKILSCRNTSYIPSIRIEIEVGVFLAREVIHNKIRHRVAYYLVVNASQGEFLKSSYLSLLQNRKPFENEYCCYH